MIGEILLVFIAIVIAVLILVFGWAIGLFNTCTMARQDISNQWSNIATEYQRRADLFMNLASSVKSLKNFEKDTFVEVAKARSGMKDIKDMKKADQMSMFNKLNKAFASIMVQLERYPKLQSNQAYLSLMDAIKITENRINIARTDYNGIVKDYNVMIMQFPANMVSGMFRFMPEMYFKAEDGTEKAPKIEL